MTDNDIPLLGLSGRVPPSNAGAEQALLGALMANNKACRHVESFLQARHFADPVHRLIFGAIMADYCAGRLVDAVTLRTKFEHTGDLDEVGGTRYLYELTHACSGIINAGEYGRSIHDAWMRRELIDIGEEIVNRAFGSDPEMDGTTQAGAAIAVLATAINQPLVLLSEPEIRHLVDFHRALGSHFEGVRPKPHGMIDFHERRAAVLDDMLPPDQQVASGVVNEATVSAEPFTEVEIIDGKAVDMREPNDREWFTPERQLFGHMRGVCRLAGQHLDAALQSGITGRQRARFERARDMCQDVEKLAVKTLGDEALAPSRGGSGIPSYDENTGAFLGYREAPPMDLVL